MVVLRKQIHDIKSRHGCVCFYMRRASQGRINFDKIHSATPRQQLQIKVAISSSNYGINLLSHPVTV